MKLAKASLWFGSVEKKGNICIYLSLCVFPQIYIILCIHIIVMYYDLLHHGLHWAVRGIVVW